MKQLPKLLREKYFNAVTAKMLCLFLPVLFFAGCKTVDHRAQTTVTQRTIKNTSLGFQGYEIEMPRGYKMLDPEKDKKEHPDIIGFYHWFQKHIEVEDQKRVDSFLMTGKQSVIVMSISEAYREIPFHQASDYAKRRLLERSMQNWQTYSDKTIYEKKVGLSDDKVYAHVSSKYEHGVIEYYVVLGQLREEYRFYGYTRESNLSGLRADIELMIDTLKFSKRHFAGE